MRTPFRSEAEALVFLLLTVAAFAAIAAASLLGGVWAGVPVWGVVTAAVAFAYLRRRPAQPIRTAPPHFGPPDEREVLVLANETLGGPGLVEEIEQAAAGGGVRVRVVCPALTSPLHRWTSDVDGARARAQRRLDESLSRLRAANINAVGEIGDEDPLLAIENALRTSGADEIIVSPRWGRGSSRLERDLVRRARERFALPVNSLSSGGSHG